MSLAIAPTTRAGVAVFALIAGAAAAVADPAVPERVVPPGYALSLPAASEAFPKGAYIDFTWSPIGGGIPAIGNLAPMDFVLPASVTVRPDASALETDACTGQPLFTKTPPEPPSASVCTIRSAPVVGRDFIWELNAAGVQFSVALPEVDNGNDRALVFWNYTPRGTTALHQGIARITGIQWENQFRDVDVVTDGCRTRGCAPGASIRVAGDAVGSYLAGLDADRRASTVRGFMTAEGGGRLGRHAYAVVVSDPWLILADPLTLAAAPRAATTVGSHYEDGVRAEGGFRPYIFTVSAGALPPGILLNTSTGRLRGYASTPGLYDGIQISVVDAHGNAVLSEPFAIAVTEPADTAAEAATPNGFDRVRFCTEPGRDGRGRSPAFIAHCLGRRAETP